YQPQAGIALPLAGEFKACILSLTRLQQAVWELYLDPLLEMWVVVLIAFICTDVDFFREMQELEMFTTDFGFTQRQAVCTQRHLKFLKAKIEGIDKILEEVQF